jgi:hypothetical protein
MGRGMHNVAKVHLGFHVGIFRDENMEAIWAFWIDGIQSAAK